MTRICHLFDATTGWEQRVGVSQLVDRLPRDRYSPILAAVDPAAVAELGILGRPIHLFHPIARLPVLAAPFMARFAMEHSVDLIHAWGPHAAAAASAAGGRPLIIELFDPIVATRDIKFLRALSRPTGFGVICSCEWVRRRLIEGGLPGELCVVVRPGIDFALVNKLRNSPLRKELGIEPNDYVILLCEPATRVGGHFEAFWAGTLWNHWAGHVKVIVPGVSREARRIARFARTIPTRPTLISPENHARFEELIPIADALVIASQGDVSTTALAWAMASSVAVIAAAGYAVAELIANKVNGLLFKRTPERNAAIPLQKLLQDRASQDRAREVARGQAYEAFSLHRSIKQHVRVYENVLAGSPAGVGVMDPAQAG